ncbi:hypothetical protein Tco_0819449 [Tanacetum coccineum]|uniref:Transposase n=1 Tax=Tanacetum coccineum TaxID=301880 RepID=A0ABQ5A6L5_9ASTR
MVQKETLLDVVGTSRCHCRVLQSFLVERIKQGNENALKAKYEKSFAPTESYRHDAFHKRDHDDHLDDDSLPEGENSAKIKKISRGSKYIKDEDEVIPEDESPELLNELLRFNKRVPTIADHKRMEATLKDMMKNQFNKDAPVFYGLQRNPNEPPRWVQKEFKMFNKEARLSIQHWKDTWHKRFYIIKCDNRNFPGITISMDLLVLLAKSGEKLRNSRWRRGCPLGTMAGVDVNTLTMEQYLALSLENQALGTIKPEIGGNVNSKSRVNSCAD